MKTEKNKRIVERNPLEYLPTLINEVDKAMLKVRKKEPRREGIKVKHYMKDKKGCYII